MSIVFDKYSDEVVKGSTSKSTKSTTIRYDMVVAKSIKRQFRKLHKFCRHKPDENQIREGKDHLSSKDEVLKILIKQVRSQDKLIKNICESLVNKSMEDETVVEKNGDEYLQAREEGLSEMAKIKKQIKRRKKLLKKIGKCQFAERWPDKNRFEDNVNKHSAKEAEEQKVKSASGNKIGFWDRLGNGLLRTLPKLLFAVVDVAVKSFFRWAFKEGRNLRLRSA